MILLLLTVGALLVQGYHPWSEDGEIYLPGVEKILNPQLFPVGTEYFQSHAHLTLFPNLIATSVRITHLPFEVVLLAWQLVAIFLLLLACWELAGLCFPGMPARWAGVAMAATLLTLPVAGTALYIMDQYTNPRNFAAFAAIFAISRMLEKKYVRALLWLIFAAAMHPLMWVFPFSYCALLLVMNKWDGRKEAALASSLACMAFSAIPLAPESTAAYHEAAKFHAYHYIQNWQWYEQLGIVAPIILFWWFSRMARAKQRPLAERLCLGFAVYGVIYLVAALIVDLPARFESLARLQPLRCLHLLYMVLFLMAGGFLGEYVLKNRVWRWLALFIPLGLGMFMAQRALFPESAHLELPGMQPRNPWAQAFVWIRQNTPVDAVFALDPDYMQKPGEDYIGFRCLAQRSRLADAVKDNGVVSMFPLLADEWWEQVQAQTGWKNFQEGNFRRLQSRYGVNWIVFEHPAAGLVCPYQNRAVQVCRLD